MAFAFDVNDATIANSSTGTGWQHAVASAASLSNISNRKNTALQELSI